MVRNGAPCAAEMLHHTLCLLQRLAASGVTMPKSSSKRGVKRDSAQYLHSTPQVVSVARELAPDPVGRGNCREARLSRFGARQPPPRTAKTPAPCSAGRNLARLV